MHSSSRHGLRQVMPFGQPLPTVLDCVPYKMPDVSDFWFSHHFMDSDKGRRRSPTADSREALATLCQTYWPPVYAFIRRKGMIRKQSQDLTQGFFTLLLEKNYLLDADERGRFRSFLLTAVKHFIANEWDREHAQKRGGGGGRYPSIW